jgi:hypothetical protein
VRTGFRDGLRVYDQRETCLRQAGQKQQQQKHQQEEWAAADCTFSRHSFSYSLRIQ